MLTLSPRQEKSIWLPGQTWSERYQWVIPATARPGTYRVCVLVYDPVMDNHLPIREGSGAPVREPFATEVVVHN